MRSLYSAVGEDTPRAPMNARIDVRTEGARDLRVEAMNQAWRRAVQIDDIERGAHRLNLEDRYAQMLGAHPPGVRDGQSVVVG